MIPHSLSSIRFSVASSSKLGRWSGWHGVQEAVGGGLAKARVARRSSQVGKIRKVVMDRRFSKNRARVPIFCIAPRHRWERREIGGAGYSQPFEADAQARSETALTACTPNLSTLPSFPR